MSPEPLPLKGDQLVKEPWLQNDLAWLQGFDIIAAIGLAWRQTDKDIPIATFVNHHIANVMIAIGSDNRPIWFGACQPKEVNMGFVRVQAHHEAGHCWSRLLVSDEASGIAPTPVNGPCESNLGVVKPS